MRADGPIQLFHNPCLRLSPRQTAGQEPGSQCWCFVLRDSHSWLWRAGCLKGLMAVDRQGLSTSNHWRAPDSRQGPWTRQNFGSGQNAHCGSWSRLRSLWSVCLTKHMADVKQRRRNCHGRSDRGRSGGSDRIHPHWLRTQLSAHRLSNLQMLTANSVERQEQ